MKPVLEKDIQKHCHHRLDYWQSQGVVIHYDDLSNAGRKMVRGRYIMNTKRGRPDIVAYINLKGTLGVVFFEVKRPDGKQSQEQKEFQAKFNGIRNAFYNIARAPKDIDDTIELITNYTKNLLDSIEILN